MLVCQVDDCTKLCVCLIPQSLIRLSNYLSQYQVAMMSLVYVIKSPWTYFRVFVCQCKSSCLPYYRHICWPIYLSSHIIPITLRPLKHIYVYQSVHFELSLTHTTLHQMLRLRMHGAISPHPTCLHGIILS